MNKFELVPDSKTITEEKVQRFASCWFKVYRGPTTVTPSVGNITVDGLTFGISCQAGLSSTDIYFSENLKCIPTKPEQSTILMKFQDKLPGLIRAYCEKLYGKPYVDLMTGQQVGRFTIEYEFSPELDQTVEKEVVTPGYIIFTSCALVSDKVSASYEGLTISYCPDGFGGTKEGFYFSAFGKLRLFSLEGPVTLADLQKSFSDQVIEGAFRQLALELAKVDQLKSVPGWTAKTIVEIE